jgi:hypothetical protein
MFIKEDYRYLNIKILKKLCKKHKIKNCQKLKKGEIIITLSRVVASKKIQSAYRTHLYKNAQDHITLDEVKYPCFIYKPDQSSKLYFYSYDSILSYITKTGDTRDPMTRIEYSDETLKRLDKEAKRNGFKYKSVYKIKNTQVFRNVDQERQNDIAAYVFRINEIQDILFTGIENNFFIMNSPFGLTVDNYHYASARSYLSYLLYELRLLLINLNVIDHQLSIETRMNILSHPSLVNSEDYYANRIVSSIRRIYLF